MKKNETVSYHLAQLQHLGSATQAAILSRFFKTGPGEYGEGDLFLGIKTPVIRQYEREHRPWNTAVLHELLNRPEHEARSLALIALLICIKKQEKILPKRKHYFNFI
nr:DNA alkylation repair protein [Porphyromonas macacae]